MKTLKIAQTANSNLQNKINVSVIFNYIRAHNPTYRARISKDLNISAPAVSRIVERLIEDGYVIETSKIKTNSGKRPTQLAINANKGIVLGIDLVKEKIKIAVSDFSGKINLSCKAFKISNDVDIKDKTIKAIKKILNDYFSKYETLDKQKLKAIGIGLPATVNIKTGEIINAPLFAGLKNMNLKEAIEGIFGVPVYIENISKLSALAEKEYGSGIGLKNLIFIEISKGIGAGIISNGNLLIGSSGSAGEIGFMITGIEALNFVPINEKGFLENEASTEAILEHVRSAINKGKKTKILDYTDGKLENIDLNIIYKAYMDGEPLANEVINHAIDLLSISIINLILILNPEIIVIGGDICNIESARYVIIDQIKSRAARVVPFKLPKIGLSKLGENAGIIGASFLAIESLIIDEFPYFMDYSII